ncbi:MAG: hypothetical protein M0006_09550 [Magnetospirillum sp.]|nr:hypothetical protein [Magnetospirillum sp.]
MVPVEVIPATAAHAAAIAPILRAADREEVRAACGLAPEEALRLSLATSPLAWTGMAAGSPVCLFGAASPGLLGGPGRPWLLATDALVRHSAAFLRRNRAYVAAMLDEFGHLANHVDARNSVSVRWLRWLGFTLEPARPFGPYGLPFHPFHMRRP